MILTKKERTELQKIIHGELQKVEKPTQETGFLCVISALLSDFEELENIFVKICSIFASEKKVAELLNSLSGSLSTDLIEKMHLEEQSELTKNITLLANNVQNLKSMLVMLHGNKCNIVQ